MRHVPHSPTADHHLTIAGPPWLPMALALVLGFAALVSGMTAWRVAIHSGHAQTGFAVSTQQVNNANALAQDVSRAVNSERSLFLSWEQASQNGDALLAAESLSMMGPSTQAAVKWWSDEPPGNRPVTPFSSANPEWATPGLIIDSTSTAQEAAMGLKEAEDQLNQSHNLELLVALLAIALLTGGLTATLKSSRAQLVLLGVSCLTIVVATIGIVVLW